MSRRRRSSRQNGGGEEAFDEPPRKLKKSEQCARLPVKEASTECESFASGVGINDLPDEVMVKILSHSTLKELMDVTQNVCTHWRRVSHDPELWRDKKFCIGLPCPDREAVAMLRQMPQLRTLVMQRVVKPSVIEALSDSCKHLTTLKLDASQQMSFPVLKQLVQKCGNIQTLSVPHRLLSDKRKAHAVAQLRQLKSLSILEDYRSDRLVHLRPFADACPKLANLKVAERVNISVEDMEYFFSMKRKTLIHVTLPWVLHNKRCVVSLLKDCSSLSYLQLNYCKVIGDEAPGAFAALGRLSNLRSLTVSGLARCPAGVAASAFESGGLSRLQVLSLTDTDLEDDTVTAVCRRCPELRELDLSECVKLTDKALKQLHRLCKLETLNLSHCISLRGEAIACVAQVTTLRKLYIDGLDMRNLEPGLEKILDITSLKTLSLHSSGNIGSFPVDRLADKLVHLRMLNMRNCRVDESAVRRLQEQSPGLEVLFEPRDPNYHSDSEDWDSDPEDWYLDPEDWDYDGEGWGYDGEGWGLEAEDWDVDADLDIDARDWDVDAEDWDVDLEDSGDDGDWDTSTEDLDALD